MQTTLQIGSMNAPAEVDYSKAVQATLQARDDLDEYGTNKRLLFALQVRYEIEDIHEVAGSALTDGRDDKKCDLIFVDRGNGRAIIGQGYEASDAAKGAAPSNKAADLNTAVTWAISESLDNLPTQIASAATELRDAIDSGEVNELHLWYVHNLPESKNVQDELEAVSKAARAALDMRHPDQEVSVYVEELGSGKLADLHKFMATPIIVSESVVFKAPDPVLVEGDTWKGLMTAIPAQVLYDLYKKHETRLLSANVRDYLGSRGHHSNINNGIKHTAMNEPNRFWVYNNGVTAITHGFKIEPSGEGDGRSKIQTTGLSIVNGAQTTGALGNLDVRPGPEVMVPARIVHCGDPATVQGIIRFNNSQNQIEAADFRSNDAVQSRLRDEFSGILGATYKGGRRGGFDDVIKRPGDTLHAYTVGQALTAFHGRPIVAYNNKSDIWQDDKLYTGVFRDETTAAHIVLVFGLYEAIRSRKRHLEQKDVDDSLTSSERSQLDFLQRRGAVYCWVFASARCLETIMGEKLPNLFSIGHANMTPAISEGIWAPILNCTLPLCAPLASAIEGGLKDQASIDEAVTQLVGLVESTKASNAAVYAEFAAKTEI